MRTLRAPFIYLLMSGITSLSYSMLLTIELVYLTKTVGFDPFQLILIGTLRQTVCFLFQAPTGVLADMYSRRWAVVLGLLLVGCGYLIEGSLPVLTIIFAAQGLWGLGTTLMDGADAAWIADEIGIEQAGSVYLRASQIGSLASFVGIVASAGLINVSLNLPLIVGGSLFIALGGVLALIMPERHFAPAPRDDHSTFQQMRHTLHAGIQLVRLRPVLLTILSIGIFSGIFSAGFDQLWQYSLLHRFTFPVLFRLTSVTWFCIIEVGIVLTNFCGTEIARRSVDTNSPQAVVLALFLVDGLMVVGVIGFALAGQFVLALATFFLFTTAGGPRLALERIWINQHLDSHVRATVFSLRGQVGAIAQIVGGPLLGLIATVWSTQTALIAAGVILSPVLFFYARFIHQRKPLTTPIKAETPLPLPPGDR